MRTKLLVIGLIGVTVFFLITLLDMVSVGMETFDMEETYVMQLEEDDTIILFVDDMFDVPYYNTRTSTGVSVVSYQGLSGYTITLHLEVLNLNTDQAYYISGYGSSTSMNINDFDGIGTYDLPAGEYLITVTPDSDHAASMSDSFEFGILSNDFFTSLVLIIVSGVSMILLLIGAIVSFAKDKSKEMNPYYMNDLMDEIKPNKDKSSNPYQTKNDNNLFELSDEDLFGEYDKRR